jgi:pimeloyl-ACP methyl ester carboxylesterase
MGRCTTVWRSPGYAKWGGYSPCTSRSRTTQDVPKSVDALLSEHLDARKHLVYAIDLPGYDGSAEPPDYSPAFTASFVGSFLDAVGVESAVIVASSFGGLVALRLALSEPRRVCALVLADSAGLDRAVNPALAALALPQGIELVAAWNRTPPGAAYRAFVRAALLFARPWQIPIEWLTGQYKVAQVPSFTRTELVALRTTINLAGQREVLVHQLPRLQMPTLDRKSTRLNSSHNR